MNIETKGGEPAAESASFEEWWEANGQFVRSGGGQYEMSFAHAAWQARATLQSKACASVGVGPDTVPALINLGEVAYQLTKMLCIDLPTARATVEAAVKHGATVPRNAKDAKRFAKAVREGWVPLLQRDTDRLAELLESAALASPAPFVGEPAVVTERVAKELADAWRKKHDIGVTLPALAELQELIRLATSPRAFSGVVEVCPDCDIADCFHIRARRSTPVPTVAEGASLDRAITFKGKDYMGTLYDCIERAYEAGARDALAAPAAAVPESPAAGVDYEFLDGSED